MASHPLLRRGRWPAVVMVAIGGVAGCVGASPEVPLGPDGQADPVLVQGRDLYSSRCASCHGSAGGGDRGPNVQGDRVVAEYPDIADQIAVVSEGQGSGMPAFGTQLDAAELEAVVRYTREVLGR